MLGKREIAEITLLTAGIILIIERLFIHAISFDYGMFGLGWLDPYVDHWMLGAVFVVIAAVGILSRK